MNGRVEHIRHGYAMWITTETLNPKPLSIISGHFREQKTSPLTILLPETSIVGFRGMTSGQGDVSYRKVAMTARRCRSYRLS
jgi:hypothetical protein